MNYCSSCCNSVGPEIQQPTPFSKCRDVLIGLERAHILLWNTSNNMYFEGVEQSYKY